MGGQTQLIVGTTVGLLPHMRSGKLKAIALTSAKRSAAAPDIPTFAESGVPGYEHEPWNGHVRPGEDAQGRPREGECRSDPHPALAGSEKNIRARRRRPVGNTPEEFAVILKSEIAKWMKVVKAAGIKAE